MNLLSFVHGIVVHYLKPAKLEKDLPLNNIYPRKRMWKSNTIIPVNQRVECSQTDRELGSVHEKLVSTLNHVLKCFIGSNRIIH